MEPGRRSTKSPSQCMMCLDPVEKLLDRLFGTNEQQSDGSQPLTFSPSDQGLLCPKTLSKSPVEAQTAKEAQATKDKGKGTLLDHNPTF